MILAKLQVIICPLDQKWTSDSSVPYQAASHSIGYRGKKHQDWFDEDSDTITALLDNMQKAQRATPNNPTSATLCITTLLYSCEA
jgi:hypothetical protein